MTCIITVAEPCSSPNINDRVEVAGDDDGVRPGDEGEEPGALGEDAYARLASVPAHPPKAQRNLTVHEF